jgi:antitoxin (DNA-binding transcriptional repressor) of toxin-antitoxin stability system
VIRVHFQEAEGHLAQLIEEATAGQEICITGQGDLAVRLVPLLRGPETNRKGPLSGSTDKTIGHRLDGFMGTWTAAEEAEFLQAIEVFERIDELD